MLSRLALKELRETAWIAAAAGAVYLYLLMGFTAIPRRTPLPITRLLSEATVFAPVMVCLAAALGLRQTVGESARGTFPFLLNRPASRWRLIGTKLLVGGAVYLVLAALPVLLLGWWLATPGNVPGPFQWSMLAEVWRTWAAATVVYLGAFLAGLRPGRWHGTRLLPLAASVAAVALLVNLPRWWITGLPLVVLIDVLLTATVLYVAKMRDYS